MSSGDEKTYSRQEGFKLDNVYEANLGARLATIEELRTELGKEGIQCPGVLVVGAQSAGKSSVLERLTGISFPRGENMCTRFPTIVQLQTDENLDGPIGYVSVDPEFINAEELHSMDQIKDKIVACSDMHVLNGTNIGDRPIHIRYARPSGPVMTLIDLPGITHVDTTGQQFDIHSVTSGMVESYVRNENMVVLVVIPANDDFGNSEALRIAQRYDEDGNRTIGVVSKCDLVPSSSDIVQKIRMVRESDVQLSLGFIAVRNKGPEESGVDIVDEEMNLFNTHSVLKHLRPEEWGYKILAEKIVDLQSSRVNQFIPEVRLLIKKKTKEAKARLAELGIIPRTSSECQSVLTAILVDINERVCGLIKAESNDPEINIAARSLEYIEQFSKNVEEEVPDVLGETYREELLKLMKEASGYTLPNFIGDAIFRKQVRRIFFDANIPNNIEILINQLGEMMTKVFEKVIYSCEKLHGHERLANHLAEKCMKLVEDQKPEAYHIVNGIIGAERSQVFTLNQNYIHKVDEAIMCIYNGTEGDSTENSGMGNEGTANKQSNNNSMIRSTDMVRNEALQSYIKKVVELMKNDKCDTDLITRSATIMQLSIYFYSDIIEKRLNDVMPMALRNIMVYSLQETFMIKMQETVIVENLQQLFFQDISKQRERKKTEDCLARMAEACKKISLLG